jgi:hypothetical protein
VNFGILSYDLTQELRLSFGPFVGDKFDLSEAQPSEFALLPGRSRDERGNEFPVFLRLK